jgi:hypothetical protein
VQSPEKIRSEGDGRAMVSKPLKVSRLCHERESILHSSILQVDRIFDQDVSGVGIGRHTIDRILYNPQCTRNRSVGRGDRL